MVLYKIIYILQLINIIQSQVSWTVSSGYYNKSIIKQSTTQFGNWLKNNIEESLSKPRSGAHCDRTNPDFPFNTQSLCGVSAIRDIAWKFELTFKESENANYKLQLGGDFGRGMAMLVNGVVQTTIQDNVWWDLDWNNSGVIRLNFDFDPGVNVITFYGGEDCCDGQQSLRFSRNGSSWKIFKKQAVLEEFPFDCTPPCSKCSMDPTECYECEGDFRDLSKNCVCIDNYFQNSSGVCQKCYPGCGICNNYELCITSLPGYYLTEDKKQANKCPEKFNECLSETVGISCKGLNRNSNIPCQCNSGYYDDNLSADCVRCPTQFQECTSPTNGTQCSGIGRTQIPLCLCDDTYYELENQSKNCVTCKSPCQNCQNDTVCKSCLDLPNRSKNIPNCECNEGYYENSLKDCVKCIQPCKYCENSTNCISCIDGYYLNGKQCIKCLNKFQTCESEFIGSICQGSNRSMVVPDCICLDGYYNDILHQDCQLCQEPCKYCENQNDCKSCINGYYFQEKSCIKCDEKFEICESDSIGLKCQGLNRSTILPDCLCQDGYYDDQVNKDCIKCVEPCEKCLNENQCIKCKVGFYEVGGECVQCSYKFQDCSSENSGSKCAGSNRISPNCDCQVNYYEKDVVQNINCEICVGGCDICQDSSTCILCSIGNYLENNECKKCNNNFSQCTSAEIGTQCGGQNRKMILPECECLEGFYDDGISLDCIECEYPCKTCINNALECLTCQEGSIFIENECIICEQPDCLDQKKNINTTQMDDQKDQLEKSDSSIILIVVLSVSICFLWILLLILLYLYKKYVQKKKESKVESKDNNKQNLDTECKLDTVSNDKSDLNDITFQKQDLTGNNLMNKNNPLYSTGNFDTQCQLPSTFNLNNNYTNSDLSQSHPSTSDIQNQNNSIEFKMENLEMDENSSSPEKKIQKPKQQKTVFDLASKKQNTEKSPYTNKIEIVTRKRKSVMKKKSIKQ